MALQPILLADDLLDTSKAGLERSRLLRDLGEELACRFNSDLQILYADSISAQKISYVEKKKMTAKKGKLLRFVQKRFSNCVAHVNVATRLGDPIYSILREEQKKKYEFVVIGSRGNKGLKKAMLGSVSEEIVRSSLCPVLVLGPVAQKAKYSLDLEKTPKILCLTDMTKASAAAERFAIKLSRNLNAYLTMCYSAGHTMHDVKESFALYGLKPALQKFSKRKSQQKERALERKVSSIKKKYFNIDTLFLQDRESLGEQVAKEVQGVYDLVVMGAHARSKILQGFIGSSTREVILTSPVPVMVVRSFV